MEYEDLKQKLFDLLERRRYFELKRVLEEQHEADVADFLEELPPERMVLVFRTLSKDLAAKVFAFMEAEDQHDLILAFTDQEVAHIIESLFVDDAVDLLEELPAGVVRRILQLATPETRSVINHFLQYPEDSAGSIMTAEFIGLKRHMTVAEALAYIRRHGARSETIYTCYVTSAERILEGVVTVRDLLLAADDTIISDLMDEEVIKALTTDDQEDVARKIRDYDLLALPVIDQENRLVGVVTVDDAIDVLHEETEEDFERMAAMSPSEKPYLRMSILEQAWHRLPWLMVLMISGMINGAILGRYEAAFLIMPVLVTFIPMLTDTGGNAGSQSSTLIIRGLAVGDLRLADFWRILWTELRVSLLAGVALAVVNFGRILWIMQQPLPVALAVSLALLVTVVLAKVIGGLLPVLANLVHVDPAIMAAPLITTIVDAGALLVYFTIASAFLGL